jgi:hypothetical protein
MVFESSSPMRNAARAMAFLVKIGNCAAQVVPLSA